MAEPKRIQVTVTVDFGLNGAASIEKTVSIGERSTVLDALMIAVPVVTSSKFGMEHFVEEIGGIKNDFAQDHGWRFEVNGHRSNVPAERYLLKDGDWINWLYLAGSKC